MAPPQRPPALGPGQASACRWWHVALAVLLFLVLAWDQTHHWHEWRYVYSAAHYSVSELADGQFDAGPPPQRSSREVGAWYWGQLLHESLLRGVSQAGGPGLATIRVLQVLYGSLLLMAMMLFVATLRRLPLDLDLTAVGLATLLAPITIYLGFKLLAEAPALLALAVASWLFTRSLAGQPGWRPFLLALAAGASLGLSLLSMIYVPLAFAGYVLALTVVLGRDLGRARIGNHLGGALLGMLLVAGALYAFWRVSPGDLLAMYVFFRDYIKPKEVSLFNVLLAGSLLLPLLPLALGSRKRKELAFMGLWAAAALLPVLIFSANYVESRFLCVALVPVSALVVLALEAVLRAPGLRSWALLALLSVAAAAAAPFMSYEMSSRELLQAVARIRAAEPQAVLLLPWNYTDYHFLSLIEPEGSVYLVQSPVDSQGRLIQDSWWEAKQRRLYGEAYIGGADELQGLQGRAFFYIGHGPLPPLQNLTTLTRALGADWVARRIAGMTPFYHLKASWLWQNPDYDLQEFTRVGNYTAYRVRPATADENDRDASVGTERGNSPVAGFMVPQAASR